jgi:hypothetical protein
LKCQTVRGDFYNVNTVSKCNRRLKLKTKQKRVTTNLIVVVVIVVVAVAAIAFVLLLRGGGGGPGGLPVYPGSQQYSIPSGYSMPLGVEGAAYTVSGASAQEILDWYKGQMTGWTLQQEESGMALIYSKGNDAAGIVVVSGGELTGTFYILAAGPLSAFDLGGRGAPPSVMLTVSAQSQGSNLVLTISHNGGDDLNISDLTVQGSDINGVMRTAAVSPSSGTFYVGGTITATYTYDADASGKVITVYVIHNPSKQKLFSSSAITVQ